MKDPTEKKPNDKEPNSWIALFRYIYRHYGKLNIWNKIGFVSAVLGILGFAAGIVIPLWSFVQDKVEKENSRPARVSLMKQLGEAYSNFAYATEYFATADLNAPSSTQMETYGVHLGYAAHNINKLQSLAIRDSRTVDPVTASRLSDFLETAATLEKQLSYFGRILSPEFSRFDFVSEGPFVLFERLDQIMTLFKQEYPDVLAPGKSIAANLKTLSELKMLWSNADQKSDRLLLKPADYIWRTNRVPCVFNRANMVRLPVSTNSGPIYLMFGYE